MKRTRTISGELKVPKKSSFLTDVILNEKKKINK